MAGAPYIPKGQATDYAGAAFPQQQTAIPAVGPTQSWSRLQQIGIGKVNLLNAMKIANSVGNFAKTTAIQTEQAAKTGATGIARTLPGGTNDLKAELAQSNQADQQVKSAKTPKLKAIAAGNVSQASSATNRTVKSMPTTKQVIGGLASTALLALPGSGKAIEVGGKELLDKVGIKGVLDLADKAGIEAGHVTVDNIGDIADQVVKTAAAKGSVKLIKNGETTALTRAVDSSTKSGLGFGAFGAANTAAAGGSNKDIIKSAGSNAAIGMLGGVGGSALKSTLSGRVLNKEEAQAAKDLAAKHANETPTKADVVDVSSPESVRVKNPAKENVIQPSAKTKLLGAGKTDTKLLPEGRGTEGNGFTMGAPTTETKQQIGSRINDINAKLDKIAQGKMVMHPDEVKALASEKSSLYRQANGEATVDDVAHANTLKNGGATINTEGEQPSKGYAYAPSKGTETTVPVEKFTPKHMQDFRETNKEELSKPGNHMGTWIENGKVYMDISKVGDASPKTIEEAQGASQLAVHDLSNHKDIPIGQIDKNGVYSKNDEASNIHNQYQRQNLRTSGAGGIRSVPEISKDVQRGTSERKSSPQVSKEKLTPSKSTKEISGSALKTEARAIEAGMKNDFKDEAEYNTLSHRAEAENAARLIHEDPEKARDIAFGKTPARNVSHASAVYHAVERKALAEDDYSTIDRLVSSPRLTKISKAAQTLGAEAYHGDNTDNPIQLMRQVADARTAVMEKKTKGSAPRMIDDITKEIASREKPPSKFEWQAFVESIKC